MAGILVRKMGMQNIRARSIHSVGLLFRLGVLVLAAAVAGPLDSARAATQVSGEPAFRAAIGASQSFLNDFNDLTIPGNLAHDLTYSSNGLAYIITSIPDLHLYALVGLLSTDETNIQILVTFTNANVRAVGGYFYLTDANGIQIAGPTVVTLSDGTSATLGGTATPPPAFNGFVSTGPLITSMTIHSTSSGGYPTLDHFFVAEGIPTLAIQLTRTNTCLISWPAPATGYGLESNPTVNGPLWTSVPGTAQRVGDRMHQIVPIPNSREFFRLRKQ